MAAAAQGQPRLLRLHGSLLQYWATFEPGDLLLATTSIYLPVVRLQDIVAIKPNGGEWIEDPKRGEP
ncbi:MAG: hypothetical protein M9927_08905 [Anaerolineae bacterium]|nr:hypothetical protein [Anaerolineae bacterium]